MSLFGESPPPAARALFSPTFSNDGSPSIFDDDNHDNGSAAWSGSPPRNRNDPTQSLLSPSNAAIPPAYHSIFSNIVSVIGGDGTDVSAARAYALVCDEAQPELSAEARERVFTIMNISGKTSLSKIEVWFLIALVGVAQQDDEINIDAVDDRRHDLPIPQFGGSLKATEYEHESLEQARQNPETTVVSRDPTTPISTNPMRTRSAAALFENHEDDPWNSPDTTERMSAPPAQPSQYQQRNHDVPAAQQLPPPPPPEAPLRHEIQVHLASDEEETNYEDERDDIHAALRNTGGSRQSSAWGNMYDGPNPQTEFGDSSPGGFGEHPGLGPRVGSFGGLGGNTLNGGGGGSVNNGVGIGLDRIKAMMKGPQENVTVNVLPEKEGMFMFQHRNYQVASVMRGSRVVRRYSDFVWLLDCLHKRYPFRQLPLLPPKRLAVNGHYLSADAAFLERRRRGLVRFTNALVRHPVLSQEQLVVMFLTVPTELSVWRKQANLSVTEEFTNKSLHPELEVSLPADLNDTFETVRSGLRRSSEIYINLCTLVERLERRSEGMAADYNRFSTALHSLTDASEATYAVDTSDIPSMNDGLISVAKSLNTSRALLEDESKAWDAGVLEDLKRHRDTLVSMRELFERMDRLATNNIPQLTKRIAANEKKLQTLRTKPTEQLKPGEIEKVQESIKADGENIERQRVRGVLIRECVRDELVFFQSSQFFVGRLHQDWSQERVKYAELQAEVWKSLQRQVEGMPIGE
ncbi:hypothetical protein EDC01DRAFT_638322 [Geopyxis carbonaria]|nr:hypothetical protein EDC01DRAFT_638322 [Geopyxis carbonaria]